MSALRLAIVASHPVQYYAPLYRALAHRCDLRVFYAHEASAQEQAAAGYGVAFDWDVPLAEGYDHRFLRNVSKTPGTGHFNGCDTPSIVGELSAWRPDVVVTMGWNLKTYWQACRAARRLGVPIHARGDSRLDPGEAWPRRLARHVTHRMLLRAFDGFLPAGTLAARYLVHYGVPEHRVVIAPHCVDVDRFARTTFDGRMVIDGVDGDRRVALFVGRLLPWKRVDSLVRAMVDPRVASRWRLVVVGAGAEEASLQQLAANLGVSAQFAGFRNQAELPKWFAAADALVLPSDRHETWGLVVNEALASGTPAVVDEEVGCAPDLVIPGETGERFAGGDVASLAAALRRVDARGGRGAYAVGCARMSAHCSPDRVAGLIVAALGRQGAAAHA